MLRHGTHGATHRAKLLMLELHYLFLEAVYSRVHCCNFSMWLVHRRAWHRRTWHMAWHRRHRRGELVACPEKVSCRRHLLVHETSARLFVPLHSFVIHKGAVKLNEMLRCQLWYLSESIPLEEIAHAGEEIFAGDGRANDLAKRRCHGA